MSDFRRFWQKIAVVNNMDCRLKRSNSYSARSEASQRNGFLLRAFQTSLKSFTTAILCQKSRNRDTVSSEVQRRRRPKMHSGEETCCAPVGNTQRAARDASEARQETSDIRHAHTRHIAHNKRHVAHSKRRLASSESSKEHTTKAEQQATRKRAALEAKARVPARRSLIRTGQARGNPIHTTRIHGNPVQAT